MFTVKLTISITFRKEKTTKCNKKFTFMIILFLYLGKKFTLPITKTRSLFTVRYSLLRLRWARGPSAAAITCFKENILHYLELGIWGAAGYNGGRTMRLGWARGSSAVAIMGQGVERCGFHLFNIKI